jgi:hypothetical protein
MNSRMCDNCRDVWDERTLSFRSTQCNQPATHRVRCDVWRDEGLVVYVCAACAEEWDDSGAPCMIDTLGGLDLQGMRK